MKVANLNVASSYRPRQHSIRGISKPRIAPLDLRVKRAIVFQCDNKPTIAGGKNTAA